ncbi:hypothetical protein P167DRAFT_577088, partial [Morchella conica CCBAS932]
NPAARAIHNVPATHRAHFFVPADISLCRLRTACNYLNIPFTASCTIGSLASRLVVRMWRLQPLPHRVLSAEPLDGFWTVPRRIMSQRGEGPYLWGAVPLPCQEMVRYGPVEDASDREDLESSGRGSMGGSEEAYSSDPDEGSEHSGESGDSGDSEVGKGSQDGEGSQDSEGSQESEGSQDGEGSKKSNSEDGEEHHETNAGEGGGDDHDDPLKVEGGDHSPTSDNANDDDNDNTGNDNDYDLYESPGEIESYVYTDGISPAPEDTLQNRAPNTFSRLYILQEQLQHLSRAWDHLETFVPNVNAQAQYRTFDVVNGAVDTSQDVDDEWSELMADIDRTRGAFNEPRARLTDACGPTWQQSLDGIVEEEEEEDGEDWDRDGRTVTHYCDAWERPVQQTQDVAPPAPAAESSSAPSESAMPTNVDVVQDIEMQNDSLHNLERSGSVHGVHITRISAALEKDLRRRQKARLFKKDTWLSPPELDYVGVVRRRVWGSLEPQDGAEVPFLRLPSPGMEVGGEWWGLVGR